MRSGIHGTFATLLLMVPVLCIPALAIFGVPQFAPIVASPLEEGLDQDRERRVGQSERPAADGFLSDFDNPSADLDSSPQFRPGVPGHLGDSVPIRGAGRNAPAWDSSSQETVPNRSSGPNSRPTRQTDDFAGHNQSDFEKSNPGTASRFTAPNFETQKSEGVGSARAQPGSTSKGRSEFDQFASNDRSDGKPSPSQQHARESVGNSAPHRKMPLTWQDAVERLNELDVRNFRLEPGHQENQFMFICSYTPSNSPRISYRFEAEAAEPLHAVEKVLQQITEWQQRR